MHLLITLTLIWAGLLVLALATGLILIAKSLWIVRRALAQVSDGLKVVESNTAPLEDHILTLNGGLSGVLEQLKIIERHLANAESTLPAGRKQEVA